ncbi:TonB-dependent hemoglobin/transferrin/lactoferrin family receptor [Labrys sp. ZIDIC5]|uniref:TonB-dependent hemoglobin/transferrin/lactoferrin family receptor n=1 Tax=Labrys sedimenti TaxID=3106036 RepID=UPI002ACA413D|nr:TonB-dependent hemoglobin/transferrin/lactoferrin family receptor [Labrys sp. ZIDIC5]MDZ5452599.1 TonB-dependent hemoglobin/transferrin/lactoferrin family receptor [Labrys sp. ZIDIC5]
MVRSNYMRSRSLATVAALALLAGSVTLARAQQAPADQAAAADEPVVLDTVTVTATKTSEKLIDTLGGVSQITQAEIDRAQPASVSDLLKTVPGVATQVSSNDPMQSINIRGMQDFGRVNVLVDGARQDYQITGHNAQGSFYLEPEFINNIDIVRGPISNLYGSGAIGGVASFTTRGIDSILTPDQNWGVEQKVGVSSNGLGAFTSTSAGMRFGTVADIYGQFIYRGAGDYRDGNNDRVTYTGKNNFGGLLKFNYHPGDGQTVSLSAMSQKFDFDNNNTSRGNSRWRNDVVTSTFTAGYKFESPDNPLINFNAKVYYSETENEKTIIVPGTYASLGVQPGDKLSDKVGTFGFDIYNTSRFSTGAFDHALTYGVDAAFDRVETRDGAGGFVTAFTPSGTRRLLGAYVQDEVRYGDWLRVVGGLRYDHYQLEGGKYESDGSHLSPKITIGVTPIKGIELYGTYAEGYRSPSISETLMDGIHPIPSFPIKPNPNLRPEVGHTFEIGVNTKYDNVFQDGDTFRAKLNGFVNNVDDYIDIVAGAPYVPGFPGIPPFVCNVPNPNPQICFPTQQYQNIAKARLMGVELEAAYDWGGGFVSVAGSHTNGKNRVTDQPLNSVAPNKVSGTVGLRFWDDRLTIGSRVTLVGATSRKVDEPSGGYGLVDVFASYKYSDNVSASLAVDNIFDRRYKAFLNSDYSTGLAAKFALTVKLAGK